MFKRYFEYHSSPSEDEHLTPSQSSGRILVASEGAARISQDDDDLFYKCILCLSPDCLDFACERCAHCFQPGHKICPDSNSLCNICGFSAHEDKRHCPSAAFSLSLKTVDPRLMLCSICSKTGHWSCASFPGPRVTQCPRCAQKGHFARTCPYI